LISYVAYGPDTAPIEKVAALNPPIVYIETGSDRLSPDEVKKLKWYSLRSNAPAAPPPPGAKICALYVKYKATER
jgi:hypothetical protein